MAITLRVNEQVTINSKTDVFTYLGANNICTFRKCKDCVMRIPNDSYLLKYITSCFNDLLTKDIVNTRRK